MGLALLQLMRQQRHWIELDRVYWLLPAQHTDAASQDIVCFLRRISAFNNMDVSQGMWQQQIYKAGNAARSCHSLQVTPLALTKSQS